MRQPPVEIQQAIREEWAQNQSINLERLLELHPEWRAEIEEWILGFLIDEAEEIPDETEYLLFDIMESGATPRRRNERSWDSAHRLRERMRQQTRGGDPG